MADLTGPHRGAAATTTRGVAFATQFAAVNDAMIALVTGCTAAQWRQLCASEEWPMGVVAHHIAEVQQAFASIVATLAAGETFSPKSSIDAVHQSNAQHAQDYAAVGAPETLDAQRTSGAAIGQMLRDFSDQQLERTAGVFGERELSVAQVVEYVVIGHAREHLASISATIAR